MVYAHGQPTQTNKFGTKIQNSYVDSAEFGPDKKILKMGDKTLETKSVIIATGAAPRLLGIPVNRKCTEAKA